MSGYVAVVRSDFLFYRPKAPSTAIFQGADLLPLSSSPTESPTPGGPLGALCRRGRS